MALHGHTTTLHHTATEIAKITKIEGPEVSITSVESTHLKSANFTKEFIAGLIDSGEIKADLQYDMDQESALNTLYKARTAEVWKITAPDTSTLECSGFVQKFKSLGVPEDGVITGSITIKLTGPVTFTEAG